MGLEMPNIPIKIMFVDDEPEIVRPFMEEATELGYEVVFCESGEEGLQIIPEVAESLALIVCDYRLGDIDGLTFRERMFPDYQHIPFIVYSGFVTKEILKNAINLKVSKFVDKPFDYSKLKQLIQAEVKDRVELIEEKAILKQIFIEEAQELLEDLEEAILKIEHDPHPDHINSIFRLVHTIKGGSGVLDWPDFTKVVHSYEDLLSKIKDNKVVANQEVVSILLKGYDFVSTSLAGLAEDQIPTIEVDTWTKVFTQFDRQDTITKGDVGTQQSTVQKKDDDLIKVPTKILDDFMELSGEITVIRNTVNKLVGNLQKELTGNKDLAVLIEFLDEMHKINSSMQNKITELRKVSLKSVFRSIPRTVRDLNSSLNKKIDLIIKGEELRVDNNLAQVLKNSLIHVIRNSADHGIEFPEERLEKGKSEQGSIVLTAMEQGDEVIVDLEDDGGGINREKVLTRAIDKGLYTAETASRLSANQINKIIMEPGFSTAAVITDVSGRGVGMDMVKSSVESIGGKIEIDSEIDQGTKFSFRLPVPKSVTIIHSLLVTIGNREFNIPQDNITRLIKVDHDKAHELIRQLGEAKFLELADNLIPLIELNQVLAPDHATSLDRESTEIVLLKSDVCEYGLIVDKINDTEEIVVKKFPQHIANILFKGATFMGDGRVGLILDVDGVAEYRKLNNLESYDRSTAKKSDHKKPNTDGEEYVIFTLNRKGRYAIPLEQIYRLEELKTSSFTSISGRTSIIYRDQIMPISDTNKILNFPTNAAIEENPIRTTIIIRYQEHFYGLLVNSIIGIKKIDDDLDSGIITRSEYIGSFGLEDGVITVIDIYNILGVTPPAEQVHEITSAQDNAKSSSSETTFDPAAGWGLF